MNVSTRFTIALHVLTLLAASRDEALTSEYIAGSVNTNSVVVRRLLAAFRKQGIVTSQPGTGGGWLLTADPKKLTMRDVRQLVNEGSPFSMHAQKPNPKCPVGRNIQRALAPIYHEAERALEEHLAHVSIHKLLQSMQTH